MPLARIAIEDDRRGNRLHAGTGDAGGRRGRCRHTRRSGRWPRGWRRGRRRCRGEGRRRRQRRSRSRCGRRSLASSPTAGSNAQEQEEDGDQAQWRISRTHPGFHSRIHGPHPDPTTPEVAASAARRSMIAVTHQPLTSSSHRHATATRLAHSVAEVWTRRCPTEEGLCCAGRRCQRYASARQGCTCPSR